VTHVLRFSSQTTEERDLGALTLSDTAHARTATVLFVVPVSVAILALLGLYLAFSVSTLAIV